MYEPVGSVLVEIAKHWYQLVVTPSGFATDANLLTNQRCAAWSYRTTTSLNPAVQRVKENPFQNAEVENGPWTMLPALSKIVALKLMACM